MNSRNFLTILLLTSSPLSGVQAQATVTDTVLSLGEVARLAATQSAAAITARYRTDAFAARALESRSALLPAVSANISDGQRTFNTASFGIPFPGFDPNGQVIGPVRTVDIRGRVVANVIDPAALGRYRAAQAATSGAQADAVSAAEQAASISTAAYIRVLRAQAQVTARSADSTLARELLDIAQAQLDAGVGVILDVTRARSQLANMRAQLITARNVRDRANVELLRSIGMPLGQRIVLSDTLGASLIAEAALDPMALTSEAVRARPDVAAAAAAVATARKSVSSARAERLPTLGLFADDGATSTGYAHLLNTYTYGVQISVPIFQGFRNNARVAEQSAVLRQAETRQRELEQQVEAEVRIAVLDVASARERVAAARERMRLAEDELTQSRDRFSAGVSGNADVITAQLNLDNARSEEVEALTSLQSSQLALARATGRLTALP
jgi:outer membrane protein TolC